MRLLVIDHNALEPANRRLYAEIVRLGEITLRLIVPTRWRNGLRGMTFTSPASPLNYELYACDVLFHSRTHRLIYRSLSGHFREFRPDIVYVNAEPENFQTLQAARLCSSHTTPFVFSSWRNIDHVDVGYPYKLQSLHRAIEKYVLNRAAHGIVFNRQAQRIYALHGYQATTHIPPPVDTELFHPVVEYPRKENFVVGYVGRLVEEKGIDLLLRALVLLPDKIHVAIVGDGPARDDLRRLAGELGIAQRVEFHLPVEPEKLVNVYRGLDAVVLPSRSRKYWREQFGRVLVEAMACGIPVLGSNSGEIPDVIGDAGLVFKEGSIEGLKLGLERLVQDQVFRQQLRERGLKRVHEKYALGRVARSMHSLFRRIYGA